MNFRIARQREPERVVPPELAESLEGPHGGGREGNRVGAGPAAAADETAGLHVEAGLREGIGPTAGRAPVDPGTMTEQIHGARGEADGDPADAGRGLERPQRSHQEPEERLVRVPVGGEPDDALDRPGGAAEPFQLGAETHEGMEDVEVIDAHEVAPAGVEEDQLAQGEGLERAPEA